MSDDDVLVLQESEPLEEFELIDDGEILTAELQEAWITESKYYKNDDGTPQKNVLFKFMITEDPHFGRILMGRTPTTFTTHPECKLRGWVEELLGGDTLPAEFTLKLSHLNGAECRVVVEKYSFTDDKTNELVERNRVGDVMRAKTGTAPTAAESF